MTTIQKTLFVKQGNHFIEYMNTVFFPSIQCPPETAERYCQAVRQYDNRAFKKYFQVRTTFMTIMMQVLIFIYIVLYFRSQKLNTFFPNKNKNLYIVIETWLISPLRGWGVTFNHPSVPFFPQTWFHSVYYFKKGLAKKTKNLTHLVQGTTDTHGHQAIICL